MLKKLLQLGTISVLIAGCASSGNRVQLPADTDTKTAIESGDQSLKTAYANQWDVLANDELMKSSAYLKKAKQYQGDGKSQSQVVEQLEYFQGAYKEAEARSLSRSQKVQGLLTAREATLNSGVRAMKKEDDQLARLDNRFRKLVASSEIDVTDFSKLQTEYLELAAVGRKNSALGTARRYIDEALKHKAARYAPQALNTAQVDLKSAENMIDANQSQPAVYEESVNKANRSAAFLAAVSEEQKRANYNLAEGPARKLVNQSAMMSRLDSELATSRTQLQNSRTALIDSREDANAKAVLLTEQQKELAVAERDKKLELALENARKQFSPSEADVYRQGDKLLIRLKTVGFATGAAALPTTSKNLLDKVSTVAQELKPKEVVVEGHTDSTGSAEVNNELSQKRAETVAGYLTESGIANGIVQSVGYGFQKPLASNKSKTGRAQNRRVDVWITPQEVTSASE